VMIGAARANPEGGTVVAGDAAIMQAGPGELIVNQTTECARFRTVCDLPAKTRPSTGR